jgi:hypothetical protein
MYFPQILGKLLFPLLILSKKLIFGKRDIIFLQFFFLVNFSTETKIAPKINFIWAGRYLPFLPYLKAKPVQAKLQLCKL